MTYQDAVGWLFEQIPNYQRQGGTAYKPGFDRINQLMDLLGNPHQKIKTIHIAGTNGKGSVSHIMAAIFKANGYKVGLFTSPHIKDFTERIKIDGQPVNQDYILQFMLDYKVEIEKIGASFFEITTALAFKAFYDHQCDISIIETGLGGRLDASNIIQPELSVITNIGLDHTEFLGDTLTLIAKEKAGIIKPYTPVVIGDCDDELRSVFIEVADQNKSKIIFSKDIAQRENKTDLLGQFQQRNIHTVLAGISALKSKWNLNENQTLAALQQVYELMNFQGRLQALGHDPLIIADAAHNKEGVKNLLDEIFQFNFEQLYIIYAASNDKDWKGILTLFPSKAHIHLTDFGSKRAVNKAQFEEEAKKINLNYYWSDSPELALSRCKSSAEKSDLILICGSFYLLEKII